MRYQGGEGLLILPMGPFLEVFIISAATYLRAHPQGANQKSKVGGIGLAESFWKHSQLPEFRQRPLQSHC